MVERQPRGQKVAGSIPGRSGGGFFVVVVVVAMYSTLWAFGVCTTHVLAEYRVNEPGHSYESVKHWMAGYREQDILYLLTSVNLHFSPPAWKKKREAHAHTRTHV